MQPKAWDGLRPVAAAVSDIDNVVTVYDARSLRLIDTLPLPDVVAGLGGKPHDVTVSDLLVYVSFLGTSDGRGYVASYIRSGNKYHLLRLLDTEPDPHVRMHGPHAHPDLETLVRSSQWERTTGILQVT